MTMSKDVVLHGSKIDWIITEKLEKLREIMDEDATFISLPFLGSENTVISVSGTTLPLIERSIRRMNKLVWTCIKFSSNLSRSRIIFSLRTLFFPTLAHRLSHRVNCPNWHGIPALRSTSPVTASRSTETTTPSASYSISSSKEATSRFTINTHIVCAFAARWPMNCKNSLPAKRAERSTRS